MTELHLGCGETRKDGAINVDIRETPATDMVVDLNQTPWPWDANAVDHISAEHVFEHLDSVESALRECHRILRPGGTLRVVWPVGMNERADPDHKHSWIWETPEMYCGKRPWDDDVGLQVVHRHVSVHSHLTGLAKQVHEWSLAVYERVYGQGRWLFDVPCTSGEFTVTFQA